jgi:hypothetical protein
MLQYVYAVVDLKIGSYSQPFFVPAKGVATRTFTDAVADTSSMLYKHPEDYALYELGTFDDVSGLFENLEKPINCGLASQFANRS